MHAPHQAQIIPFPSPVPVRREPQITIDGEFYEDDLPPELFDVEEDREELALYVQIADHWND